MKKIVSIKGFDKNLCCRGYRFEIGETYKHEGGVTVCESGFHAVEYGIDAFSYYAPADSVYLTLRLVINPKWIMLCFLSFVSRTIPV